MSEQAALPPVASGVQQFDDVVREIISSDAVGRKAGRNDASSAVSVAVQEFQAQISSFGLRAVERAAVLLVAVELRAEDLCRLV